MKKPGVLFIISAPSATGKTTLATALLQQVPTLKKVKTYTTRPPRSASDEEYFYISQQEFHEKQQSGFFLEWSQSYGALYGSPKSIVDSISTGASYLMILDRDGARAVIQQYPAAVLIWIYPTSIAVLHERLLARGTESEQQIQHRIVLAADEMEQELSTPLYKYHICNSIFADTLEQLKQVIKSEQEGTIVGQNGIKYEQIII
jgi:guanylate kinase